MSTNKVGLLVGMHFRPPAKQILEWLSGGAELRLVPEPTNEYDENAVKVLLSPEAIPEANREELRAICLPTGKDYDELMGAPIFLGYLGNTPKTVPVGSGYSTASEIATAVREARGEAGEFSASAPCHSTLGFTADGKPAVLLSIEDMTKEFDVEV